MLNEKCGVFGIFGEGLDVSRLSFYGLFSIQHRGQEATGIAVADGYGIAHHKGSGLVTQVYSEDNISQLKGHIGIGQNLYSTCKISNRKHIQPVIVKNGLLALAHNGNLPSTKALQVFLTERGVDTTDHNDSELMAEAIAYYMRQGKKLAEAVEAAFPLFTGAFSLLVMDKSSLVAVRDAYGLRPLSMARINSSSGSHGVVFSSETCSFNTIGAKYDREVKPGEMIVIGEDGERTVQIVEGKQRLDIFEFVYFSRPDSVLLGQSVYEVRKRSGRELAKEKPLDVDIVIPVPDTAVPAAIGYAQALKLPMEMALTKNRYIHRTFIQPDQHLRELGVKLKLSPLYEAIKGKKVVLIDDSIVRGTTSQQIVGTLFEAGATEVHFLISSPPVRFPDFYGIDTPVQKDLIAATKTEAEIQKFIGATSIHYLSLDGLLRATGLDPKLFCTSCFTGDYPLDIQERAKEVCFDLAVTKLNV